MSRHSAGALEQLLGLIGTTLAVVGALIWRVYTYRPDCDEQRKEIEKP
jgi:hypothetical protein